MLPSRLHLPLFAPATPSFASNLESELEQGFIKNLGNPNLILIELGQDR
jgi:hypothetical protein